MFVHTFRLKMNTWLSLRLAKNVNWNETWLCVVIIGCTKKLLWKNQDRPCWIQRENNDVNVYATSSLSVKRKIFPLGVILMLHCGLGIRNTNTFYTFRCPQSLEMIRLYLCKKCKLEREMLNDGGEKIWFRIFVI
jgi:hypothetical protein